MEQVINIDFTDLDDAYHKIVKLLIDNGMVDREARVSARFLLAGVEDK
jgi:hypothetical protein